jgi:large subunit ribosomal protein L10
MARPDKVAEVDALADRFAASNAVVLTEYRGLTMAELSTLRRSLGGDVTYAVVKNTLARRAASQAGADALLDAFTGPSAIAFVSGDPVEAAKGLRDFGKTHPALVLRGGLLAGRYLDAAEVAKLADLESREVLLAKAAGLMKASLSQAVSLFAAPLAQAARAVDALRQQVEEATPATPQARDEATAAAEEPAAGAEELAAPAAEEPAAVAADEPPAAAEPAADAAE